MRKAIGSFCCVLCMAGSALAQTTALTIWQNDSIGTARLLQNGVRKSHGKIVAWFPKDSLPNKTMDSLVRMYAEGLAVLEKEVGAPLPWQAQSAKQAYTIYARPDSFISHISTNGEVYLPFWRVKAGQSPWLHELVHEVLNPKAAKDLDKKMTPEEQMHRLALWLHEGAADYLSMVASRKAGLERYDVFTKRLNPDPDSAFRQLATTDKAAYIVSFMGVAGGPPQLFGADRLHYAPTFYNGAASFVHYLDRTYGRKVLLDAAASFLRETESLEGATGKRMDSLRADWLRSIGLVSLLTPVAKEGIGRLAHNWNLAFNRRDTAALFALVDSAIAETIPSGTRIGVNFKSGITNLWAKRPDVSMYWNPSNLDINTQWPFACDSGEWVESWTEKGDTAKSTITGKYFRMWRRKPDGWKVVALTLTPLHCTGSYCNR